jgi:Flp pilus assembly pilin Flp
MGDQERFASFWRNDEGQAATEYILIVGLISLPIYLAVKLLFEFFVERFITAVVTSFTRG